MAHELSILDDGTVEAAFAGQKPWHNLGTMVDDLMTPSEALNVAHLDWTVETRAVTVQDGPEIPDQRAVVRTDTGAYLGTVGTGFVPLQNREQAEFLDALVGEGACVECVGALRGGARTFWTVRLPENIEIASGDEVEKYLIMANGHDGKLAFSAFWSPIRVVCQNTLNAALRGMSSGYRTLHTGDITGRVNAARATLGLAGSYYDKLGETFRQMRKKRLSVLTFRDYVDEVFPASDEWKEKSIQRQDLVTSLSENFEAGRGADLAKRTLWGAYNAVTEYLDHQQTLVTPAMRAVATRRGEDFNPSVQEIGEKRMERILWGSSRQIQQRAFDAALARLAA